MVVAETDAEAKDLAASAYEKWRASFAKLWVDAGRAVPMTDLYPESWEQLEASKNGIAGSPETVRDYVLAEAERCGTNYLVSWFAFGDLPVDAVIRSVELFSDRVMPAFD